MKKKLFLFAFLGFLATAQARIVTYSVPAEMPRNTDYSIKVREAGGDWVELFGYSVLVDMHDVRKATMVRFDFDGPVEMAVTPAGQSPRKVEIRPGSCGLVGRIQGKTFYFTMQHPEDLSVEFDGDRFHNLHVFTNCPEERTPEANDTNLVYFGPGFHVLDSIVLKSGQHLYLAGGAIVKSHVVCNKVRDVLVDGRGIFLNGERGVQVTHSSNVRVNDLVFVNPVHYTVFGGASEHLSIHGIRSFSSKGWGDGIDLMSCRDVTVDSVFLRTSDDCIALYGHRWEYYGDCRDVQVLHSVLWADVAHPVNMGTHGNPDPAHHEVLEHIRFCDIDILGHDEPQLDYQGCLAINVSDGNLARDILFEDIRVENIERGQLFNLRVTFNKKYATAPGRGIEDVTFRNVVYTGKPVPSIIEGYAPDRAVRRITFENLVVNGMKLYEGMKKPGYMKVSDFVGLYEGVHVEGIRYLP